MTFSLWKKCGFLENIRAKNQRIVVQILSVTLTSYMSKDRNLSSFLIGAIAFEIGGDSLCCLPPRLVKIQLSGCKCSLKR